MSKENQRYKRNADGVLEVNPIGLGRLNYEDPGEALLTWWAGELRFGCAHGVFRNYSSGPCGNAAKYDPDHNGNMTKCGHHSRDALERKKAKQDARYAEYRRKAEHDAAVRKHGLEREEIIQKIANGHNDPRGLCQDWLDRKPWPPAKQSND